uniref:Uncharacterized protein n=1 Tax=Wuchereria bancrofti TaxID=6293 RepID=A0A1I8EA92_WUCBA
MHHRSRDWLIMAYFLVSEEVSPTEAIIRRRINFSFRLLIASFSSYQIFDFLFSPIWIHGYIWSLNQKVDLELSTKSAVLTAISRCLQTKQRLYSAIHEGFYAYFLIFFTGLILTLQVSERITDSNAEVKSTSIIKSNFVLGSKKFL